MGNRWSTYLVLLALTVLLALCPVDVQCRVQPEIWVAFLHRIWSSPSLVLSWSFTFQMLWSPELCSLIVYTRKTVGFFSFLKNSYLFCYSCTSFSPFSFFCPAYLPTPIVNPHSIVHVHGSFIHVIWLVPSPSCHYSPFSSPRAAVSLFHVSVSPVLFCSLVYFAH